MSEFLVLDEVLKRSIVTALNFFGETARRKLLVLQMMSYAFTADAFAWASLICAWTALLVLVLLALHDRTFSDGDN